MPPSHDMTSPPVSQRTHRPHLEALHLSAAVTHLPASGLPWSPHYWCEWAPSLLLPGPMVRGPDTKAPGYSPICSHRLLWSDPYISPPTCPAAGTPGPHCSSRPVSGQRSCLLLPHPHRSLPLGTALSSQDNSRSLRLWPARSHCSMTARRAQACHASAFCGDGTEDGWLSCGPSAPRSRLGASPCCRVPSSKRREVSEVPVTGPNRSQPPRCSAPHARPHCLRSHLPTHPLCPASWPKAGFVACAQEAQAE